MQLYVVQTGETIWEVQQRVDSLGGVPLNDTGKETIRRVGKELVPHQPTLIYASSGESEKETAALLAEELGLKIRTDPRLDGFDFGLWQGLTISDIRHRQPKLFKQWLESPSGIRPPSGESLQEAQQRVCEAVREIVKKGKKKPTAPILVLRPMAMGVLRCKLEKADLDNIWKFLGREFTWTSYDVTENEL